MSLVSRAGLVPVPTMTPPRSRSNRSAAGGTLRARLPTRGRGGCWSPPMPGNSKGHRTRAWKAKQARLAAQTGLEITCCHFPPGTSKWNAIEHRLFPHISMNWCRRPLISHEVIATPSL